MKNQSYPWPWVDSPNFETLLAQSSLDEATKALVKQFSDKGYVIFDPEIEDFEQLSLNIIQSLEAKYNGQGRIQDAWTICEEVREIAIAPKILSLLTVLYQREPIPFQTLNFPRGTQQKTHSDTIHFQSLPKGFMCGVWIALEDIDLENGPLHYYPGSHKLPMLDLHDMGIRKDLDPSMIYHATYAQYENYLENLVTQLGLVKAELVIKKGMALVWAANLLHGGSPILDPERTRHSQVTHYFFKDCLYYTPLVSSPFDGYIHIRQDLRDISTGEVIPHYYQGREVQPCELGAHKAFYELSKPSPSPFPRLEKFAKAIKRRLKF